jgi:hypothetical protein
MKGQRLFRLAGAALTQAAPDIRDIRGPKTLSPSWIMPALFAGLVVAALCAWALWRWRKRRAQPANRSLCEKTIERLEAARPLMTPATARAFGIAASEVIRHYIEERFEVVATQRTTEEFLHGLPRNPDQRLAQHRALLEDFLEGCDRVKFAGTSLALDELERLFRNARRFVLETRAPTEP